MVREDGSIVNYEYDGLGRRIEKEVDSVVTQYIYDNEDILLELDGSNNIVARYTHGLGIDEPLIVEKGGQSFFYHADDLGSITELTDTLDTIVQSYTYSSFGKIESQLDPAFIQPYTFTARELDSETGLYHYRARYYDPATGRFLQQDPIGFAGGDLNLYAYVGSNPLIFTDPFADSKIRNEKILVGKFNLASSDNAVETAIKAAKQNPAVSKFHIKKLQGLLKAIKRNKVKGARLGVVNFFVFGLLDDLALFLEALEFGCPPTEQFRKNVEELGNPEFVPVGGILIPNPFHTPGGTI